MARRYARRSDPPVPRIHRIELDDTNLPLRLLGLGIAIAVAAAAFGFFVNTLVSGDPGWQEITASHTETGITAQFSLNYYVGGSDRSPSAEKKQVASVYGESANEAYRILSNEAFEGYHNVKYLNEHPNEAVTVEPLLYAALEKTVQSGNRYPYLAPLFSLYDNLLGAEGDEIAVQLDPAFNADTGKFVSDTAAFAAEEASVQMELLGDNTVRLKVSDDYRKFLRDNEEETIFDFGVLRNSFILDAIADALTKEGLTAGILTSMDGYTRTLSEGSYSLNIYTQVDGSVKHSAVASYEQAMALTTFRAFPLTAQEEARFYTYEDGTKLVPYLKGDGSLGTSADFLTVFARGSCADTALAALTVFTADALDESVLNGYSWVVSDRNGIRSSGADITVMELQ